MIKDREVAFSFFPVTRREGKWRLSDTVFAVSPWAVMQGTVNERLDGEARAEATAFLQQARDFYVTASERLAANPLLFYYAFLNLGKALLRIREVQASFDHAHHGLFEGRPPHGGLPLDDAIVRVKNGTGKLYVFPELFPGVDGSRFASGTDLPVRDLLAQIVVGHRQWRDASEQDERFIALTEVEFVCDAEQRSLWARLFIDPQDMSRYDLSINRLIDEGHIGSLFRHVQSPTIGQECIELIDAVPYTSDPGDGLTELVARVRPALWRIVSTLPGGAYRRYYLHLTPPDTVRVSQLASLWALWFYFGSVVRYRPHGFDQIIADRFGAFVTEFVAAQPEQLLYLLASDLCSREVAKPAIA